MSRQRLGIGEFGEMSAKRTEKGWRARARYRNAQGKVRQLGAVGDTKRKAETALRNKMSATLLGHRGNALTDDNPSIADLGRHWLENRRVSEGRERGAISPSTKEQYRNTLEMILIPGIGELLTNEATVARLEAFLESLIDGPAGSSKAIQSKTVLRQIMDTAVRYGYIEANPVVSIRPFTARTARPPKSWTPEEVLSVRGAVAQWADGSTGRRGPMNTWLPGMLDVMLGTGCRISEALALSWDRVHLNDTGTSWLRIDRAVREPKRGPHSVGPTKSGDVRDLEIPEFLAIMLRAIRPEKPGTAPVFATKLGTWIRPSAAHRAFRAALDAADVDRIINWHLRPHGARKTAATLIARKYGAEGAAAQLGHAGTHTAERHYIEPAQRQRITNASVLEQLGATG